MKIKMNFPQQFLWGAASSAYQIEGACAEDGKGLGIWDSLSDGHVAHNENGNIACDHYHRYKEDVALMKEIGLKAYRFSISWPRIMPAPGVINEKGIAFYRNLVQELTNAGIEPMCTLFHWNLPMWVHEKGGWHNEEISDDFASYVKIVIDALSDKVRYWMTVNEPACFIGNGYIAGNHAPYESMLDKPLPEMMKGAATLTRNVLLSHGKAVQCIRTHAKLTPKIGMALNGNLNLPRTDAPDDIEAARLTTFSAQGGFVAIDWWADAPILGIVPDCLQEVLSPEDMQIIHQPLDFFGYNCYNSNDYDEYTGPNPAVYPGMPRTSMGWAITPDALYWAARFFTERYRLPILITENGMANVDFIMSDGKVHDPQRIEYMKAYLTGLQKATKEGIPVLGYLYWSILDNFEWAEGYDKRFGLVYVDYLTQERTRKESSYWYAELIARNSL